jgi:hypothetical protein
MTYRENLFSLQNADGGWSYHRGASWAEPTCFAALALVALGAGSGPEVRNGLQWLRRCQRPDGGIAPREQVDESTWLTALPLLLPSAVTREHIDRERAVAWLLAQTGRESGWLNRVRLWMLGIKSQVGLQFDGWPWYPGAAAWVGPTAISILALKKLQAEGNSTPAMKDRLQQGQAFLLDRRCRDGGWNHGSTRALGYDSDSYPETTGLALLALRGAAGDLAEGLARAEQHLNVCRSHEAADWLRLGLLAHGRKPTAPTLTPRGGTLEMALAALADAAEQGRNLFLES